jgi:hypothetical protein
MTNTKNIVIRLGTLNETKRSFCTVNFFVFSETAMVHSNLQLLELFLVNS